MILAIGMKFTLDFYICHSLLMLSHSSQLAPQSIQKILLGALVFLCQEERRVNSEEQMQVFSV